MPKLDLTYLFIVVITLLLIILITFIILIVLAYQRRHNNYEHNIASMKSEFDKTLLSSQLEMQEQTFQNISREIHDIIGLPLSLAKWRLIVVNRAAPAQIGFQLLRSIDHISKAISDLSSVSRALNTDFIKELGLLKTIELEIQRIENLGFWEVNFLVSGEPVFLSAENELVVFRVIQEALNNTIKHAQAKKISFLIDYGVHQLRIEITDNGRGFDTTLLEGKKPLGTGLLNMTKRIGQINGKCEIKSTPGYGTTIILNIPYLTYEQKPYN